MGVNAFDGIHMGGLVTDALHDEGLSHKEAWLYCGYPNASQWSKALIGQAPLDLWRMRILPVKFWQAFLPKLASAVTQQAFAEAHQEMRLVRGVRACPPRQDVQQVLLYLLKEIAQKEAA